MCLLRAVITPLILFILLFNQAASAQVVRGIVTDSETGEPLPSATVLYEGTFRGTIANLQGEFSIEADEFPATLLIRYIGYESERLVLNQPVEKQLLVGLDRSVTELSEIVVTDEDPGLSIMERVIERKKIWREELKTYEVDAFTRQVLRNDTSIVSIMESGTRSYWDSELGHREVQLYRRQTTNIGDDQNFAGVRFLPNFYDDNITVAGYDMVGITHPDALRYYDFKLIETTQIDGEPVYKIEVIPVRRLQPLFRGTAYVLGSKYALLEVDLTPNDVVSFPPPVKEFNLAYRQQYSDFSGNVWLPVDMRINGTVRIEMVGLRFPPITFSQTSRLSEYKVNVDLPDSLYEKEEILSRVAADTTADFSRQLVPLTREEEIAYESIDSTNTLEQAFEPEGFLAGFVVDDDDDQSVATGVRAILPSGVDFTGRFNRVDGFNAGLEYRKGFADFELDGTVFSNYSFHAEFLNYGAEVRQKLPFEPGSARLYLNGGYFNHITRRFQNSIQSEFLNGFQTALGGIDYFDYYRQKRVEAGIEVRRILPKTDLYFSFNSERDQSVQTKVNSVYNHSLFGWHKTRRANSDIFDGTINSLKINVDFNRQSTNFGISGSRQLRVSAEKSGNFLESDADFTKLAISANWNMETFFGRRVFANTLDLQMSAGVLIGDRVPQRYGVVDGSLSRFSPFGTLKTRWNRPYEGTEYWTFTAEHNFRTVPFELIGLNALVERGWGVIVFGGAGYSKVNGSDLSFTGLTTNGVHTEAGISLNSIFGILRIDAAKRLDAQGSYIGVSLPRYF